jgi:hypothetical protein
MFPVFGLLGDNRSDKSIEFLDVFLNGVGGEFLATKELTFKTKFIFSRLGTVALLKNFPDIGGGETFVDASLVLVGDGLLKEGVGLNDDLGIEGRCFAGFSGGGRLRSRRRVKIVGPFAFSEGVLDVGGPGAIIDRIELGNGFVVEFSRHVFDDQ